MLTRTTLLIALVWACSANQAVAGHRQKLRGTIETELTGIGKKCGDFFWDKFIRVPSRVRKARENGILVGEMLNVIRIVQARTKIQERKLMAELQYSDQSTQAGHYLTMNKLRSNLEFQEQTLRNEGLLGQANSRYGGWFEPFLKEATKQIKSYVHDHPIQNGHRIEMSDGEARALLLDDNPESRVAKLVRSWKISGNESDDFVQELSNAIRGFRSEAPDQLFTDDTGWHPGPAKQDR